MSAREHSVRGLRARSSALLAAMIVACGGRGATGDGYVTSAVCGECHTEQHALWMGSHHERAMLPASADSVRGDFRDTSYTGQGLTTRFSTRDGRFFVNTEGPDGRLADFEVGYTFGWTPLQQYLVELPGGRLQVLPIAWDTVRERWFHLYPDERLSPDDAFHWTGRYQRWNAMCADCHSTGLQKGYDPDTDSYRTRWAEIQVGCEACHGPGRVHVERARRGGERVGAGLRPLDAAALEIEACAPCHARRLPIAPEAVPARGFLDRYRPELLRAGRYFVDGQIQDEVYVWGSFVQSRMHRAGVRCSDCHEPHGLTPRAEGNALCASCHAPVGDARFPRARGRYDTPDHHFHAAGSAAAQCVACHMPERTYMRVDARRDHGLRVPRPDLAAALGTPDACTGCHGERSPDWAAAQIDARRGTGWRRDPGWPPLLARGRAGARGAGPELAALARDAEAPAIVRATALDLLVGYGPAEGEVALALASDDDALVRAAAAELLAVLPEEGRLAAGLALLRDPVRRVRVAAARALAPVPRARLSPADRARLQATLEEYRRSQLEISDLPSGRFNLATLAESRGDLAQAERHYLRVLELDSGFRPARFNLANLYNREQRNPDAERVLRAGIERSPGDGELHYSLGLLLAEEQRLDEAIDELSGAAERIPARARVRYNLGLALQQAGRWDEAEPALLQASRMDPHDAEIAYALAVFYAQRSEWESARSHAARLVELAPGAPAPRELLRRIEAQLADAPN